MRKKKRSPQRNRTTFERIFSLTEPYDGRSRIAGRSSVFPYQMETRFLGTNIHSNSLIFECVNK